MLFLIAIDEQQYTELSIEEDVFKDALPEDWTNDYYPSYIPEGYELVSHMKTEVSKDMRFINGDKKFYYLKRQLMVNQSIRLKHQI